MRSTDVTTLKMLHVGTRRHWMLTLVVLTLTTLMTLKNNVVVVVAADVAVERSQRQHRVDDVSSLQCLQCRVQSADCRRWTISMHPVSDQFIRHAVYRQRSLGQLVVCVLDLQPERLADCQPVLLVEQDGEPVACVQRQRRHVLVHARVQTRPHVVTSVGNDVGQLLRLRAI